LPGFVAAAAVVLWSAVVWSAVVWSAVVWSAYPEIPSKTLSGILSIDVASSNAVMPLMPPPRRGDRWRGLPWGVPVLFDKDDAYDAPEAAR
jgi:hypothetical protein